MEAIVEGRCYRAAGLIPQTLIRMTIEVYDQPQASRLRDSMPLTAGKKLGPYEILSARGTGGMGEVYRARDTRLDRVVAVKILRTDLSVNDDQRRRFEREARAV